MPFMPSHRFRLALLALLTTVSSTLPVSFAPPSTQTAVAQTVGGENTELEQLYQTGVQQYRQGQLRQALATLQKVLERSQAPNADATWQQKQGEVLNQIGLVYEALGEYPRAIEAYEKVLSMQRTLGDRQGEGAALSNLGTVYARLGQYPKALEFYRQGLARLQEVGDRESEGAALAGIGLAYRSLGQYPKALEFYQKALNIAQEIQDRRGEGTALNNIAVTYSYMDDYAKALAFYEQSLAIRQEIGDRRGEGLTLTNLGGVYDSLGQYARALAYYEQALKIRREVGDRAGEGTTLNSIALTYDNLGQSTQALQVYQDALAIRREIGDRAGEGITLNNLGRIYAKESQLAQALQFYQQALAVHQEVGNRTGEGVVLNNVGEIYRLQQQPTLALASYQQALQVRREVGDRAGEGVTLNNIGAVYDGEKEDAKALDYYQQALKIFQAVGDRPREATVLGNLGALYKRQGQYPEAEKQLSQAINVLESLRPGLSDANKVSIFETQVKSYRWLEEVLVAQQKPAAALTVSERGRARAFVELLATRLATPRAQSTPAVTAQPPNLKQIQQIARQQRATLVEYSIIPETDGPQGAKVEQEARLFIWVVQPTGEIQFRQIDLQPFWQESLTGSQSEPSQSESVQKLADLVAAARGAIGVGGRGLTFNENAEAVVRVGETLGEDSTSLQQFQQLYEILIQPIADLLPSDPNAPVIFIPQGALFLVPFAALQDASGTYLIQQHTILTAPAIQVLALTQQQQQQVQQAALKDALVVGNPLMPSLPAKGDLPPQPLASLPGAESEAKAIAQLLNTQAMLGDQATKAAILRKLPQAKIIHLATHGLLEDFEGLGFPGAIALAPAGSDDGFLTTSEILTLKLNADLVVLSACDTGRGRITGDGVIGLSRSLISAGTPSVVVSLWQVPDAPTAELMTEFYKQLQPLSSPDASAALTASPVSKAQALRQAMLTTLAQYPDPRDWAGFTLVGESD